jgi:hypothetical protein
MRKPAEILLDTEPDGQGRLASLRRRSQRQGTPMFVTEEEGNDRLSDPRNVLTRVDRSDPDSPIEDFLPPDPIVDFPELSDAEPVKKSKADQDPFTALKLDRILFPHDPGRKAGIRNRTNEENGSVALTSLLLGGPAAEEMFGVPQVYTVCTEAGTNWH